MDHIYSIADAFREQIPPEIVASSVNLQLLPSRVNLLKGKESWITKEELFKLYEESISKGEQ